MKNNKLKCFYLNSIMIQNWILNLHLESCKTVLFLTTCIKYSEIINNICWAFNFMCLVGRALNKCLIPRKKLVSVPEHVQCHHTTKFRAHEIRRFHSTSTLDHNCVLSHHKWLLRPELTRENCLLFLPISFYRMQSLTLHFLF